MKILGWQPLVKNTMRGLVDVELELRLQIYECIVHGPWVALPSKVVIDKDGAVRRNLATGKIEYARVLKWRDKATGDKFSTAVIRLLLARYPDALDGGKP